MSVKPGDEVTIKGVTYKFLTKRIDDNGAWWAIKENNGKVYVLEPDGDGWKVREDD